jgi:hypothetical protein
MMFDPTRSFFLKKTSPVRIIKGWFLTNPDNPLPKPVAFVPQHRAWRRFFQRSAVVRRLFSLFDTRTKNAWFDQ